MKIADWLQKAQKQLDLADIETARLDTLVLLEDITGWNRAWILANSDQDIQLKKMEELEKLLNRRAQHEPLAYIRGKAEFYGREFVITSAVLQPRPESETMIDSLKALVMGCGTKTGQSGVNPKLSTPPQVKDNSYENWPEKVKIGDVGTGSGALGITAALELPGAHIELLEIDESAVKVAKTNVAKFTIDLAVIKSDLLASSRTAYDLLLCNLPYIPATYIVNKSALQEPKIALFGGPDGLDIYRKLFQQIDKLTLKPLFILTESLPEQHQTLATVAKASGYKLLKIDDFIQVYSLHHASLRLK